MDTGSATEVRRQSVAHHPTPRLEQEKESQAAEGEVLTCRICRGEETTDEPLFYPCKCSGSIRYVHQECLMEWLARSGKRHCELCKTPFRFTKLYNPSMPASVPVPIFLRQACIQILAASLRVLRWALVLFVWLAWVPWAMRLMWRFLFWLADGAWIEHPFHYDVGLPGSLGTLSLTAYSRRGAPNSTLSETVSQAASEATSRPGLLQLFSDQVSSSLWDHSTPENTTTSQPFMVRLGVRVFKGLFPLAGRRPSEVASNTTTVTSSVGQLISPRVTLLSEIDYLRNLTRWPFINRTVMDILEGQMITIFVMVFLVLVFLIREWVVQQQPGAGAPRAAEEQPAIENGPQAENDNDTGNPGDLLHDEADDGQSAGQPSPETTGTSSHPFVPYTQYDLFTEVVEEHQTITAMNVYRNYSVEELRLADYALELEQEQNDLSIEVNQTYEELASVPSLGTPLERQVSLHGNLSGSALASPMFFPSSELRAHGVEASSEIKLPTGRELIGQNIADNVWGISPNLADLPEVEGSPDIYQTQRPQMPSRNALDRASRLHRVLEEERSKVAGDRWPGIATFMDYWNRGNCDPQVVLTLIHEEGREDELAWIVHAMRRLQRTEDSDSETAPSHTSAEQTANLPSDNEIGTSSRGSWQVVEDASTNEAANLTSHQRMSESPEQASEPGDLAAQTQSLPLAEDFTIALPDLPEDETENAPGPVVQFESTQHDSDENRGATHGVHQRYPDAHSEPATAVNVAAPTDQDMPSSSMRPVAHAFDNVAAPEQTRSIWDILGDVMWGGVELLPADQQQVAGQLQPVLQPEIEHDPLQAAQLNEGQNGEAGPNADRAAPQPDPEVLQAARAAGIEPEDAQAVEEAEDFDGLVELVGLEGPLVALLQHAVVCAAIVSLVVFLGIWIPYTLGKVMLVILSNPMTLLVKLPLRWILFAGEVLLDTAIFLSTGVFYYLDSLIRITASPVGWVIPFIGKLQQNRVLPDTALTFSHNALERLINDFSFTGDGLADSDIPYFSIVAHESLVSIQGMIYDLMAASYQSLREILETPETSQRLLAMLWQVVFYFPMWVYGELTWEVGVVWDASLTALSAVTSNPFKLRLDLPVRSVPLDLSLIHWSAWDRVLAIALGYLALYIAGSIYTSVVESLRNPGDQQDDTSEIIYQARGVLKVITIISIEMIAFPLYCGVLLDIALLPLFRDATILSRLAFTAESPWTSLFLHWFVGTCYMFHFALFVSMCRKEMRSGVLYFIRDPDDETFHPVRDVLERNLGGQLRKIAFSALVYGALVIVCLGTVVWTVGSLPYSVLPVTWSSANSATELQIDLCIYNFLIPIAIKVLQPSRVLTDMYKYWFRECAKILRLSHFLFGDRRENEEGFWTREDDQARSQDQTRADSLANDSQDNGDGIENDSKGESEDEDEDLSGNLMDLDVPEPVTLPEPKALKAFKSRPGQRFVRDGRFVRAPATDRVRIPRGHRTFLPVDENNDRADGQPEVTEGLHAKDNKQFEMVYLPPHFQTRIALFAGLLWAFATATGLFFTVLPLSVGRLLLAALNLQQTQANDIHAYILGAYVTGIPSLLIWKYQKKILAKYQGIKRRLQQWRLDFVGVTSLTARATQFFLRISRILYFYSFAGIVLPTLFSAVFWFYVAVPVSTLTGDMVTLNRSNTSVSIIQNWVLGFLFMRVAGRFVQNHQESRFTRALYAIVRGNNGAGWLDPDVKLATRAFILPSLVVIGTAMLVPPLIGSAVVKLYFPSSSGSIQILIYRYSYPSVAGLIAVIILLRLVKTAFNKWRSRIRDEVYLVGERLHNFGEKRSVVTDRVASSA